MDATIRTPRAILREVISQVARERRLNPEAIEGRSRQREVVAARIAVAKRLFGRGVAEERIARMMHTNLETVQIFLGRRAPRTKEHAHGQDGTEGSGTAGEAGGARGGEQAPDR